MTMTEPSTGRTYHLEEIFENQEDYHSYITRALALFQDQLKKQNPTLKKFVPEIMEVEFHKGLKSVRLFFPRYKGIIVIQVPDHGLSPRRKALIRERMLERYVGLIKSNELAVADEFAMRMKVIDRSLANKHGERK